MVRPWSAHDRRTHLREGPFLQYRVLDVKELGHICAGPLPALDAEGEIFIGDTVVGGLAAIDWGMNLKSDVEKLTSQEVSLIRRKHAS